MTDRRTAWRTGGAACALLLGAAAFAQGGASAQDGVLDLSGELSVAAGLADGAAAGDADALIRAEGTTILKSGLELGAGTALRLDGQRPHQTYAGGRYSSLLSGGTRGVGPQDGDLFLEGAYLFARGGLGSVYLGRDDGVASRLAVTSPSIFRSVRISDWRTDLTGLNDVHTVNDFSGTATKVTYMPPTGLFGGVIGQFQVGLSYAPRLADCGADACAPEEGYVALVSQGGVPVAVPAAQQGWRDVVEAALYYQNDIDVDGDALNVGLGASFVRAEEDGPRPEDGPSNVFGLDDYRAYAFGVNLNYGPLTVGGSVKSTNAGLASAEQGEDYLAFDAGVTYEAGDWNFMLGYGAADAERDARLLVGPQTAAPLPYALDRRTQTAQAGVSKVLGQGVRLGVAAQFVDSDKPDPLGGKEDAAAIVLESSIRF